MLNLWLIAFHTFCVLVVGGLITAVVLLSGSVMDEYDLCSIANGDYVFECHNATGEIFENKHLCFDFELVQDHIRTFHGCISTATTTELEQFFAPNATWPCYSNAPLNKLCDVAIARRICATGAIIFCLVVLVFIIGAWIVFWTIGTMKLFFETPQRHR